MLTGRELKSHEALLAINAAVAGRLLGGGFEGGQDVSRLLQSQAKLLPIVGSSSVVRPFIQPARRAPRGVLSLPRSMPTVYANASPGQGQGFEQRGILVLGWAQGGQIQVGFVNGHLLKCGPRSPDKLHDLARLLPVMVHPGPDKDALRAKPFGCGAGQGRPDAELPRCIAGGTHDPALGWRRTDDHRLAPQGRIVPLLHGGVERIHVQMEDDTKQRPGRFSESVRNKKSGSDPKGSALSTLNASR